MDSLKPTSGTLSIANTIGNRRPGPRTGAMLPLIALVMIILFVAACISIDIARIHTTRSELRTATDAAARAGVEALGRLQSREAAIAAAVAVAGRNTVAGRSLTIDESNIEFGTSSADDSGAFRFDPDGDIINSIRVVGARDESSADGPVGFFIGPLFGVDNFQPVQVATATRLDRDIALVLDVSGSMRTDNRFGGLQTALDVFLTELEESVPDEHVSLTVYSTDDRKRTDLTPNLGQIRQDFAEETPDGRTAIGRGLQTGLDSILNDPGSRPFALKSIVLMTDGRHNTGIPPEVVANQVADENVTVHTITFSDGAQQGRMQTVAERTGGVHFHADNDEELIQTFREIARTLGVLLTE